MIVCKKCGFNNTDADAFCGSCGAFLEWTGEKVTPATTPEPAHVAPEPAGPAAPARRGGFMALVQQVTAIGVPKKEAIDPPGTASGAPLPSTGIGARPAMPATPAPLGVPTPRPLGPSIAPPRPGLSAPPSGPPSSPPRSAPPSGPPSSPPAVSAPPSGPPRSAPPSGPPPGAGPTSAPPSGPPPGAAPRSAPPAGPPPGVIPTLAAAEPSSPAPVAPSLPKPMLPPPTLPAPAAAPTVIRVTPEPRSATIEPASLQAPTSLAPSTSTEPAGIQPTAVRSRIATTPLAAPPTKEPSAGDLVCGQCGEGNEPVRKFCRRCGNSLATAVVASTAKSGKFRRERKPRVLAAGEQHDPVGHRQHPSSDARATVVSDGQFSGVRAPCEPSN